jgi:hypothetical protein
MRVIAGALLGVLLATGTWVVGIESRGALGSLGVIALLSGPGFLALGVALSLWLYGEGTPTRERRLSAMLLGMAGSASTLLGLTLVASLVIGVYALLFAYKLVVPALAGGLGVGLGCQIGPGRDA